MKKHKGNLLYTILREASDHGTKTVTVPDCVYIALMKERGLYDVDAQYDGEYAYGSIHVKCHSHGKGKLTINAKGEFVLIPKEVTDATT